MKKVKKINSQFGLYRIEKLEDSKIEKLENWKLKD
jgi:hypothetical protein